MASLLNTFAGRILLAKSKGYSLIIGITGETQVGKSTFCYWLANEITRCNNMINPTKWHDKEWNYEKYCAKSFSDFVNMVDTYNNKVIVIEEAGFDYGNLDWYKLESKLFGKIFQTQAFRRNVYIIVLPHMLQFGKAHRHTLNFLFWCYKKFEKSKIAIIRPQLVKREYWKLKDENLKQHFMSQIVIRYTKEELQKSTEFTNWLKGFKDELMNRVKIQAGIIKVPLTTIDNEELPETIIIKE